MTYFFWLGRDAELQTHPWPDWDYLKRSVREHFDERSAVRAWRTKAKWPL